MDPPDGDDHVQDVVDPVLRAHISSLCSALGGTHTSETGEYVLGDDAFACLKDLKRWLKGYDEKLNRLDVARVMAESHLVVGDLLEIISSWDESGEGEDKAKSKLVLACVELLVPLTWPLDKDPKKMTVNHYKHMGVLEYAQAGYKKAILHHRSGRVLRNCVRVCLPSMSLTPAQRSERDEAVIRLVLYLLRNVAMIAHPNPTDTDTGEEIGRSAVVEAFERENVLDLLVMVASQMGDEFVSQDSVVMEIVYHLVKGVEVEKVFLTEKEQASRGVSELEGLLMREKRLKSKNILAQSSRHSRFGTTLWVQKQDGRRVTVSGQDVLADKSKGLAKMDDTKRWKKPKAPRKNLVVNDFDMKVALKGGARKMFRGFVEQFLDAGFNPLFSHLRRAIEREAERILPESHPRKFLYLVSWFLGAERMRRKNQSPEDIVGENLSFGLIASVLNQETLILLKKYMMEWFDMKQWSDLEAGMRCMIQLLLTVQDMALSPLEEDQDIAENMQNRIFYEESTLELILTILRSYKTQGFGYLDTCTELAHVHLRLLERYSKQNTHIFIKSKRQTTVRKKNASATTTTTSDGPSAADAAAAAGSDSDSDGAAENTRVTRERAFDFIKYETKFLSQPCVDTFLSFLQYYRELDYTQTKRALSFLHRVFVKRELEASLFRLDVLELLNRMVQGPEAVQRTSEAYKEVQQFGKYYIKQLVRRLQKTPALYVELLFTKTNRSHHYIQYGHEPEQKVKKPRQPAELEVSPRLPYDTQVGVAVSVLLNEHKDDIVDWLKTVLSKAIDERLSWESEATARRMEEVSLRERENPENPESVGNRDKDEAVELPRSMPLVAESDARKSAVSKDQKVMMLLRLLGLKGTAMDAPEGAIVMRWEFPPGLSAGEMKTRLALLKKFTDEPPVYEDGRTAEDFVRRKAKPRADRLESSDDDDDDDSDDGSDGGSGSDGDGGEEEETIIDENGNVIRVPQEPPLLPDGNPNPLFEPNIGQPKKSKKDKKDREKDKEKKKTKKKKKTKEPLSPEDLEAKLLARRKREEEKNRSIKSALYVDEEDDLSDDERDRVFFEREKELRAVMERTGGNAFPDGERKVGGTRKKRKKAEGEGVGRRKKRRGEVEENAELEGAEKEKEKEKEAEPEVDEEDRIPEDALMESGNMFFSDDEGEEDSDIDTRAIQRKGHADDDDDEDEVMKDADSDADTTPPSPPQKRKLLSRPERSVSGVGKGGSDDDDDGNNDENDEPPSSSSAAASKPRGLLRRRQVVEDDSDEE